MIKVLLIVLWTGLVCECMACKCDDPGSIQKSFQRKGIIVTARVIEIDTVSYSETLLEWKAKKVEGELRNMPQRLNLFTSKSIFKVKVVVTERFKGENVIHTISIYTPVFSGSCGYRFQLGREYIIYGEDRGFYSSFFYEGKGENENVEKEHTYWTNHCTRTRLFDESEVKVLRELRG